MGILRDTIVSDIKRYVDPKHPETSQYDHIFPSTSIDAVFIDQDTKKPLSSYFGGVFSAIINTDSWNHVDGEFPYFYEISIAGLKSTDRVDIFITDNESSNEAIKCNLRTKVSVLDDAVRISALYLPEIPIQVEIQIGISFATDSVHIKTDQSPNGETISEHNVNPTAHPDIRDAINKLKGEIAALKVAVGGEITGNAFSVTFGDLDGVIADGIFRPIEGQLAF